MRESFVCSCIAGAYKFVSASDLELGVYREHVHKGKIMNELG